MCKRKVEDLEPGDSVVIGSGISYHRYRSAKISKVTATQITIEDGTRFSKKTCEQVGDKWGSLRLQGSYPYQLMSIEEMENINKEADRIKACRLLADKIKQFSLNNLPLETLQQVAQLIGLNND